MDLDGLTEHEEVFVAVVAGEGSGDLLLGGLAAGMSVAGQHGGIGLSGDDVAQDGDSPNSGNVADHVVELEVHEHHGPLHALDAGAGGLHELVAMAHQAAQGCDGGVGPEAPPQETKGVQLLDPLAIEDVGLAPGNSLDVSRVDQEDLDSPLFEDLVEGNPIDPRGLHGHGVDAAGLEPVGQRNECVGEALELAYWLLVTIFGNRDPVAFASDVDSSGVEVDRLEDPLLAPGALGRSS